MEGQTIAFIVLAILDIPLFILIGKVLFGSWEQFWEAIEFWLELDFFSALDGKYWNDIWAEAKLTFFTIICIACIYGEIRLTVTLFGDSGTA